MCWSQKQRKLVYEAASYKIETIPDQLAAMSIETDEDTSKFKKAARR